MELALSLGNRATDDNTTTNNNNNNSTSNGVTAGFCMGLSPSPSAVTVAVARSTAEKPSDDDDDEEEERDHHDKMMIIREGDNDDHGDGDDKQDERKLEKVGSTSSSADPSADISPRQLDLLPFSPVPRPSPTQPPPPPLRFPWLSDNLSSEPGSSDGRPGSRLNRTAAVGAATTAAEEGEEQSSPNSGTSSFMEFSLYTSSSGGGVKRRVDHQYGGESNNNNNNDDNNNNNNNGDNGNSNYMQGVMIIGGGENGERGGATTSRGSDDDENGSTRKKLRLSKEQSAFLEESFKEHHTLNPKQKLALAKQLNLRPRQVEVWFQNRRARTKLKQTEVDCEYLKRCCETLTEENRRLQKELQELRALKTSQSFFMQLPATTLTMCPSCERVAPTSSSAPTSSAPAIAPAGKPIVATTSGATAAAAASTVNSAITLSLGKPKPMLPFSNGQAHKAAS